MKDHLIFDTTDSVTIADSDSVGAFVRAGDDGTLIGHVSDALKVSMTNASIAVTATDLDIRDLAFATDSVDVSGSNVTVSATDLDIRDLAFATDKVDVSGSSVSVSNTVTIQDGGSSISIDDNGGSITVDGSVTVSASDLDIRDLVYTQDSVTAYQGGTWTVDQGTNPWVIGDGGGSITVDATDLDIRNLDHGQDSIKIGDGTDFLAINPDGSINVNADISVASGAEKQEDAAHADGDIGQYVLAVRQDTLSSSTSADGDYASLKVSAAGALYVNLAESSGSITVNDAALADTAILSAANLLDTADTAEAVKASALANRKYLWIYNNDNTRVFLGGSGVTAANGFPVSPGSYMELRAGAAVSPFFVGQSGKTPEIRTLELS